ncbi:uncharacterized protein LOC126809681 [Patella vulgata]|uniref:uncharacterized protein LOC126809681 n=1 Tax=Patella vulgata TaxID=6465 RepID=UPI0024A9AE3A|nr:uncharacterized protein LOC126809681 [Patella vulgata]
MRLDNKDYSFNTRTILMEKLLLVIIFFRLPSELDSWVISDACTDGSCNIHHLTCNKGKGIQLGPAYYGFTRYGVACDRHCRGQKVYKPSICFKLFSNEDYHDLKQKCNRQKMCYVTTPGKSNNISCKKKIHTVSRLYYSCVEATRQETGETEYTDEGMSGFPLPTSLKIGDMTVTIIHTVVPTPIDDLMITESTATRVSTSGVDTTGTLDIPDIVGSVTGCFILVILLAIIILVVIKRRTVSRLISKHIQGSRLVENPGYETTGESYNHVIFSTDNSSSTRCIEADDYNHLHDVRNNNSTDNANNYNHLRIPTGKDKQFSDDYNHLGGDQEEKIDDDYSHIGVVTGEKDDYNHIGGIRSEKINDDYNHIGAENFPSHGEKDDHYNHLGDVKKRVSNGDISRETINKDDYPDETNYTNINISNYENFSL